MQPQKSYLGTFILIGMGALIVLMLNAPTIFSYLAIILIAAAILAMASVIGYVIYWCLRNRISPTIRTSATVVRRRKKEWDSSVMYNSPPLELMGSNPKEAWKVYSRSMAKDNVPELTLTEGTNYFVTFEYNNKETEFSVPGQDYIKSTEGTKGLLVYRGEEFKYFIPSAD